jgi:hypothetical protein
LELLERQYQLPPYSRTAEELAQLQKKVSLWSRAAPVIGRLSLVAGSGYLGWKIGTGIRSLWIGTELPSTSQAAPFSAAYFFAPGSTIVSFWGQNVLAPTAGWALEANGLTYFDTIKAQSPCPLVVSVPPAPAGAVLLTKDLPQPAGMNCYRKPSGPWVPNTPAQQGVMFLPLKVSAPVEYTGQPVTHTVLAGIDLGVAGTTTAVKNEIESYPAAYPNLVPWLEETLDDIDFERARDDFEADGSVDEMVEPERDTYPWTAPPASDYRRWCELSGPGAGWSSIEEGPGWFESYHSPPSFSASTIGGADLLFGTDQENGYGRWNNIVGFGVRKIAAKHGWSSDDALATAAALQNPPVSGPSRDDNRYEFRGMPYEAPTTAQIPPAFRPAGHCARVVVVATTPRLNEPRSRGIITSFGKWFGPRPEGGGS